MTSASARPLYQTDLLAKRVTVPWSMRLMSWASAIASSDDGKSIGMVIGSLTAMGTLLGRVAVVRVGFGVCAPGPARSGSCRNLLQRHDVVGWRIDNALDKSGQSLEGALLFVVVGVAVIDPANAPDDVAETPFSDVGVDAGPRHERARGAPQVVQRPIRQRLGFWVLLAQRGEHRSVKLGLEFREARNRRLAARGENVAPKLRHTVDNRLGRRRQRPDGFPLAFHSAGRDNPVGVGDLVRGHIGGLVASGRGEEQKPHIVSERPRHSLCRLPYDAKLVVAQHAVALMFTSSSIP